MDWPVSVVHGTAQAFLTGLRETLPNTCCTGVGMQLEEQFFKGNVAGVDPKLDSRVQVGGKKLGTRPCPDVECRVVMSPKANPN